MFTKQGSDQGCGKWLSTKNTRKIAQSLKQKNAKGTKKGRRKPSVFTSDHHVSGVCVSSTPMSPRLVEMLTRAKQAKVEQFFKPVVSKDLGKISESGKGSVNSSNGDCQMLQSFTTPLLRKHHKLISDQDEIPVWDDNIIPSTQQQNEAEKLNISGILPIELSNTSTEIQLTDNNLGQALHLSDKKETNQHEGSSDEIIKSPVSKRFRCMREESPKSSLSQFQSSLNDDDENDSDSFRYTQWVNEQIRKSKELQDNGSEEVCHQNSEKGTKFPGVSGESPTSTARGSTDMKRKYSQDKPGEIFSETESEFRFSEWALQQKAKCKRLQENNVFGLKSCGLSDEEQTSYNKVNEITSPNYHQSEDLTDSYFQYTDWIREQKIRSKELQQSLSKEVSKTCLAGETLKEHDLCIPELQIFEKIQTESECRCKEGKMNDDPISRKSKKVVGNHDQQAEVLRNIDIKTSSRQAFKDVSNGLIPPCNNKSLKIHRNKLDKKGTEKEGLNDTGNTFASQESEPFHYTEWTHIQKQICKQVHEKPETVRLNIQDDFWDIPSEKKADTNSRNEGTSRSKDKHVVLASDTDQESDTETCPFLLGPVYVN